MLKKKRDCSCCSKIPILSFNHFFKEYWIPTYPKKKPISDIVKYYSRLIIINADYMTLEKSANQTLHLLRHPNEKTIADQENSVDIQLNISEKVKKNDTRSKSSFGRKPISSHKDPITNCPIKKDRFSNSIFGRLYFLI